MAHVEKRGPGRWRVRYRDPAGKERYSETLPHRADANREMARIENSKSQGSWTDPRRAKVTVDQWATQWLAAQQHLKPSTRARYAGIVAKQIMPRWGRVPLARVSHGDAAGWVADLHLAPATVRYVHRVFSLMLDLAVRDGRLASNPANGVRLPRAERAEKRFLTHRQVQQLADAAGDHGTLVSTLAYTGVRWGEAAALRVGRLDLMRRRLTVAEAVTEVRGQLTWGTPKSHQHRVVPVPRFLVDDLAVLVAGKAPTDLVFTTSTGATLRNLNWRRDVFDQAATSVGLDGLTPHELRHTAASLAIASGADVKAVQRMLGHASAAVTLDVYSGLFDTSLDLLADRLDSAASEARASTSRPGASPEVIPMRSDGTGNTV